MLLNVGECYEFIATEKGQFNKAYVESYSEVDRLYKLVWFECHATDNFQNPNEPKVSSYYRVAYVKEDCITSFVPLRDKPIYVSDPRSSRGQRLERVNADERRAYIERGLFIRDCPEESHILRGEIPTMPYMTSEDKKSITLADVMSFIKECHSDDIVKLFNEAWLARETFRQMACSRTHAADADEEE